MMAEQKVAQIIVQSLINANAKVVFGIPGAKVDAVFDTLSDHPEIRLVVCRHEQNAAFMAAAVGRITGTPGVCIATSGPGAGNLTTGLVTATTEGDPVVAIVGSVPRLLNTKHTHQSMKALDILRPTAKSATNIDVEDQAAEVILAAFRTANGNPKGSAVVSLPMDVAAGKSKITAFPGTAFKAPLYGTAPYTDVKKVAKMIDEAKLPVLFLGMRASSSVVVSAVREFLKKHPIAVVETFQAAGAVPESLADQIFFGRVGLFRNQIGDRVLAKSDLIITLGYDPTEYDANSWNPHGDLNLVHVDYTSCDYGAYYHPEVELLGSVRENILALGNEVTHVTNPAEDEFCQGLTRELRAWQKEYEEQEDQHTGLVQPLRFISALQKRVSKDTTVTVDVGTVYIYMMRYFYAYEPRKLLCSNGQQTLGVGMPWAIAASLTQDPPCSQKVVSLSGDGGFMFSSQELSTAVQQGCNITHFIWNDEAYNMVEFQEEMKYGRSSGIKLGGVDFVKYAESFGGKGFRINNTSEIEKVMDEALAHKGLSLVDVRIDYSHAKDLSGNLVKDSVG
ncbi:Acetolactate synthase [Fulvia fulva]|uniref:Acetolactate synthase n=1 Tax=Passalora fulva TaxID=5499 RepID=A0A9Q8L783_PASFU|nr:Acetolactate synthase [Fulvia fulva]KAK4636311.1 Acetolactate synthase [Fulvia fulva]KAK4637848.1 Acetolactate synthase [Fulvia fulva]UJO12009.1 Acetolactate synthase [Fulvia fulva]WPV09784.1 Acetolactate synthase [Fulvia fulva]WPV24433.1 Acetolactate synthase [Fulvia fulva]